MKCPHCGAWTVVKETRTKPSGYIRVRVCANEHQFRTNETPVIEKGAGTPTTHLPRAKRGVQEPT